MSIKRASMALLAALLLGGCGGETSQEGAATMPDASTADQTIAATSQSEPAAPQPATIADLFPEGDGRIMVLNNCSSCHAVACSAIGQRTEARWDAIQSAHGDRLPGLSESQLDTLFGYLAANFNDTLPEPNVPRAFLATGCTPQ